MKRYAILLVTLLLLISGAYAQNKKKVVKKPRKTEVVEDPRITQMLSATQRIMFIDSMVVDKQSFCSHIPLSPECGKLLQADSLGQFTNELNDYRLTTVFDLVDSLCHLNRSYYIVDEWTEPEKVQGIDDASANFPYLMPDGTTLYFAQKGEKSIGGYDLFVTRYDAEDGTFLRADNMGMPFSSEANDYLYVIDETYQLGYFVTDRRQPEGMVCIYVFIPNDTRRIYQPEAYTEEQIRSFARIDSISATWTDNDLREQGLRRLELARTESFAKSLKVDLNKPLRQPLDDLRHQAQVLEKTLQLSRNYYARASESDRATLRNEILSAEKELEMLQLEIKQKEKEQRNQQYQQP